MFSMPDQLPDREPTKRELAAIEKEWPQIEADLAALDAEITELYVGDQVDDLIVRRARRTARRTLRALPTASSPAAETVPVRGGEAA